MFVTRVQATGWESPISNPSWADVEVHIRAMNGEDLSDLVLQGDERCPCLVMGGGKDGWFVASLSHDNVHFHHLLEREPSTGSIEMYWGGQPDEKSLAKCVHIDSVLVAAKEFYETGTPSSLLRWKEESVSDYPKGLKDGRGLKRGRI